MAKKIFKKWLPHVSDIKKNPALQILGDLLHDPNLWHMNRHSLSGAAAVGLFSALLPIPLQMLVAAIIAILFRVNLPLSIALVWVTNPVTIPPIFYFAYRFGLFLMGEHISMDISDISMALILEIVEKSWQPLLLGSLVLGVISALIGFFTVHCFWRIHVLNAWKARHEKYKRKRMQQHTNQ